MTNGGLLGVQMVGPAQVALVAAKPDQFYITRNGSVNCMSAQSCKLHGKIPTLLLTVLDAHTVELRVGEAMHTHERAEGNEERHFTFILHPIELVQSC